MQHQRGEHIDVVTDPQALDVGLVGVIGDDLAFEPHRDRVLRELERAAGYPAFEP